MNSKTMWLIVIGVLAHGAPALAQEEDASGWGDLSDFETDTPKFDTRVYGYIDSYWEKVGQTPAGVDEQGETVYEDNPYAFDVLNMHLMFQGTVHSKYRFFLNLASPGSGSTTDDATIGVRNAWVQAPLIAGYLNLRVGKTYRQFGLYNEILDAVPTFIGIEAPELFDKDHLMLTRTTNLTLLGTASVGSGAVLNYALSTGNDERAAEALPVGADLHLVLGDTLKVGSSFYTSGGDAAPSRAVGEGSPRGGVMSWMEKDQFMVYGGYGQFTWKGFILQAAFWQADHDATYDEASVLALADADLSPGQLSRFYAGGNPANGLASPTVQYSVTTAYLRTGYEVALGEWTLTPYGQVDFYKNPETIASKDFGGDGEAGLSDDGQFFKYTLGAVLRPVPEVAFKVDGSTHVQDFNGEAINYSEVRASLSYLWQLED